VIPKNKFDLENLFNKIIKDSDVIYTDSWMSYHIPEDKKEERKKTLWPYRVTKEIMSYAKSNCIFMNCLPADRNLEQEADVIDGA